MRRDVEDGSNLERRRRKGKVERTSASMRASERQVATMERTCLVRESREGREGSVVDGDLPDKLPVGNFDRERRRGGHGGWRDEWEEWREKGEVGRQASFG